MTTQELGQKLAGLREGLGLKQEAVATELGISRNHLGDLERGEVSPRVDELERILRLYKWNIRRFFDAKAPDHYANPEHAELHRKLQEILEGTHSDLAFGISVNVTALHNDLLRRKIPDLHLNRKSVKPKRK